MKLLNLNTGEEMEASIERVNDTDLIEIAKEKRFKFDWNLEKHSDLYKLIIVENQRITGLLSLQDIPKEIRIHIRLIESSKENIGKQKELDRIPGCLIAFACSLSFKKGYGGFVSLVPKTELVQHYIEKYGFSHFGQQLAVQKEVSNYLIIKYLNDGK